MKKQILPIILSILIAFALWSYVVIVVGPEYRDTFYNVKVDLESVRKALEEEEEMFLMTESATIKLELSGNRVDLNKLNSGNIVATVDAAKLAPGKMEYRVDIRYPDNVANDAFTIEGQYPARITLDVAARADNRQLKVEVDYNEEMVAPGYSVLEPEQEFDEVWIYGPEDIINQISVARVKLELTEENNKTGIKEEEYTLSFYDANNNQIKSSYIRYKHPEQEKLTVSLPIYKSKTVPLKLHVKDGGGATAEKNVVINPATIMVVGSEEALENFHELYLNTEDKPLDLSTLTENSKLTIDLDGIPEGVKNESGIDFAEVTVSFDDLETREITLEKDMFRISNLPAEMEPEIAKKMLTVTVRGTKESLQALNASQIIAVLDFTDAAIGYEGYWPVSVSVVGAPENVGVVDKAYNVWVVFYAKPKPQDAETQTE